MRRCPARRPFTDRTGRSRAASSPAAGSASHRGHRFQGVDADPRSNREVGAVRMRGARRLTPSASHGPPNPPATRRRPSRLRSHPATDPPSGPASTGSTVIRVVTPVAARNDRPVREHTKGEPGKKAPGAVSNRQPHDSRPTASRRLRDKAPDQSVGRSGIRIPDGPDSERWGPFPRQRKANGRLRSRLLISLAHSGHPKA